MKFNFSKFENITFLRIFNASVNEETKKYFPTIYALKGLVKRLSFFKSHKTQSYIDFMLAKRPRLFQITCVTEIRLSDVYKVTKSLQKIHFRSVSPKIIGYNNFKNLDNNNFMRKLNQSFPIRSMEI